ncbi:hypothetical protein [Bradyrhizobium sp.]|jgi:hypothetical protein|uniref:hypothetical protein n=1 Tax=Bradyrhizobium sp. TaxID=376 RepID=UPI003C181A33
MGVHDFDDPLLRKNNWLREAFVPSVQVIRRNLARGNGLQALSSYALERLTL